MRRKRKSWSLSLYLPMAFLILMIPKNLNAQTAPSAPPEVSCASVGTFSNGTEELRPDYTSSDTNTPIGTTSYSQYPAVLWCVGDWDKLGTDGPKIIGSNDWHVTSTTNCTHGVNGDCCSANISFTPTTAGTQHVVVVDTEHVIEPDGTEFSSQVRCVDLIGNGIDNAKYSMTKNLGDMFDMTPTKLACGVSGEALSKRTFLLQCIQKNSDGTMKPVDGCTVRYSFEEGSDDGGHDHPYSNRVDRFGRIPELDENAPLTVPAGGLTLTYQAPEAAGEVKIHFMAVDPKGNAIMGLNDSTVRVKIAADLVDQRDNGISIFAASHPDDGFYGTASMKGKIANAVDIFDSLVAEEFGPAFHAPGLKSEAASLHWGGLFDYQNTWHPPHCGHRNGTEFDLSMSVFNSYSTNDRKKLKKILATAIAAAEFQTPVSSENASNPSANHWHLKGN